LPKITTYLALNHSQVVIEDLNVAGMLKNHKLASAIADCGFFEFKRQLEYKCLRHGSNLTIIDRWYPSSQICSNCGARQKMPLRERVYKCSNCDNQIDRDLNAAKNIANWTVDINYPTTCSLWESNACGEVSKLDGNAVKTSPKQEGDVKPRQLGLFGLLSKFE
jgi:putative transposase